MFKDFKCVPELSMLPGAVQVFIPTSTWYPQAMPCDLPTAAVLESPSPINSSLKPSPICQLTPKMSFYPSGEVGSIRPQHTLSLSWFKPPKFWWKHKSQSKVVTSWAHLFVSSFPHYWEDWRETQSVLPNFFSIVPRAFEISFDWPQTFCCYIIISSHVKEQEWVVAWRLQ